MRRFNGAFLRARRHTLGLTIVVAANHAGAGRDAWTKWERGQAPHANALPGICDALQCSLDDLFRTSLDARGPDTTVEEPGPPATPIDEAAAIRDALCRLLEQFMATEYPGTSWHLTVDSTRPHTNINPK